MHKLCGCAYMVKMVRNTISVPENLDLLFRTLASTKFKFKKGWYGRAIAEAIELWIKENKNIG